MQQTILRSAVCALCAASPYGSAAGAAEAKKAERFPASEMVAKTMISSQGQTIPYRIYIPQTDTPNAKLPVLLYLHGAGSRGTNNTSQLGVCVPQLMTYIVRENHPAILIVPQCPDNEKWVDTPWNKLSHTMPESPSRYLQTVIELLDNELAAAPVDHSRLYIGGVSMGGYGVWDMLQRFPQKFAAALIMCGGGDTNLASTLIDIPIRVIHGTQDTSVPVERARTMVDAIHAAGGTRITYVEHPDAGHNVWYRTCKDVQNIEWIFSNRLDQ